MRTKLNIRPKTKLAVYRSGNKLVLAKLSIPSLGEELKELFGEIDSRYKRSRRRSEKEILAEIQAYRTEEKVNEQLLREGYVKSSKELKRMSKEWSTAETPWPE